MSDIQVRPRQEREREAVEESQSLVEAREHRLIEMSAFTKFDEFDDYEILDLYQFIKMSPQGIKDKYEGLGMIEIEISIEYDERFGIGSHTDEARSMATGERGSWQSPLFSDEEDEEPAELLPHTALTLAAREGPVEAK